MASYNVQIGTEVRAVRHWSKDSSYRMNTSGAWSVRWHANNPIRKNLSRAYAVARCGKFSSRRVPAERQDLPLWKRCAIDNEHAVAGRIAFHACRSRESRNGRTSQRFKDAGGHGKFVNAAIILI